jgi:serine/threonine protein kinase
MQRMLRAARATAKLRHPRVVPVYRVAAGDRLCWFVTRPDDGETLSALLEREGPLPIDRVTALVNQVGAALTCAHEQNIVHGDLTPLSIVIAPDGTASVKVRFETPTFPNGVVVETDGSIVWDESYTGHVKRLRTDGKIEDLGRMPGDNPILDGMAIAKDGSLLVTDLVGEGFHVLARDGTRKGFVRTGGCPTNLAFDGETLWITDASVLASSAEPNYAGRLWKVNFPGGGAPTAKGSIASRRKA